MWRGYYYHQSTVLPSWLLIPQHYFQFPTHSSIGLLTWQMNTGPQFIYWAFMHHPRAEVPTCLLIRIPLHIVSIAYSSKCRPADLPDEYRSPSSSIEHFCILIVPKCQPADLPTYSPAYFPHFQLIQVPTCQMNTGPPVHLLGIYASS